MDNRIIISEEIISKIPLKGVTISEELMQSEIMDKIIVEIYNGWPGNTGLERVADAIKFIAERIPQYAEVMGKSELETLEIIAKARRVNYTNWFQKAYLPDISNVYVFDRPKDFFVRFPSGKYQCPACNGISTDYSECNSGIIVDIKNQKVCDWKVYGLFGGLGKEIKVIVKNVFINRPNVISMFRPIELLEEPIDN